MLRSMCTVLLYDGGSDEQVIGIVEGSHRELKIKFRDRADKPQLRLITTNGGHTRLEQSQDLCLMRSCYRLGRDRPNGQLSCKIQGPHRTIFFFLGFFSLGERVPPKITRRQWFGSATSLGVMFSVRNRRLSFVLYQACLDFTWYTTYFVACPCRPSLLVIISTKRPLSFSPLIVQMFFFCSTSSLLRILRGGGASSGYQLSTALPRIAIRSDPLLQKPGLMLHFSMTRVTLWAFLILLPF